MSQRIDLKLERHGGTGLLAAMADELPGLLVFGDTVEELVSRLPRSIEVMMKATHGKAIRVLGVELDPTEHNGWADYESARAIAMYEEVPEAA